MIPKVAVFDLGKVLLDFDYGKCARNLATQSRSSAEEIRRFIDHSPLLFRFETGLMNKTEFYREICAETGFKGTLAEFEKVFGDIFEPMPEMVVLHQTLRNAGMATCIFSNTNEIAIEFIRGNYPFFQNFNNYVLSYEAGAMKPHPKIYEVVEAKTNCRAGEIIYLDDRAENIAAGAARGWQVVLQESPEKSTAALKQAGLV